MKNQSLFWRVLLPHDANHIVMGNLVPSYSLILKSELIFFPPHSTHIVTLRLQPVHLPCAHSAICPCFLSCLTSLALGMNKGEICGQTEISVFFYFYFFLSGLYLLRENLAGKSADILPEVTSQKIRPSQDVAITTIFSQKDNLSASKTAIWLG